MIYLRDLKQEETTFETSYVVLGYTKYNDGDRRNIITINEKGTSTNLYSGTISDLEVFFNGSSLLDSSNNLYEFSADSGTQYFSFDFLDTQVLSEMRIESRKFNNITIDLESSNDRFTWTKINPVSLNLEDNNAYTDYTMPLNMTVPAKYFRIKFPDIAKLGNIYNIRFTTINSQPLTKTVSGNMDTSSLAKGNFNFDHDSITNIDSSGNKRVSFNIINNTIENSNQNHTPLSFTAERLQNGETIIPGTVDVNGYLGVNQAIFGTAHIYSGTYLQTKGGTIKFYDNVNADWRDLNYYGTGVTLDGFNAGPGLYIQIPDGIGEKWTSVTTTENFVATATALGINAGDSVTIDDTTASTTTVYSSTQTDTLLGNKLNSDQVLTPVPADAVFTDTLYDDSTIQTAVDLNTAKVSNVEHPLVETAVPADAVFTDTKKLSYLTYDEIPFATGTITYEIQIGGSSVTTEILKNQIKVYAGGLKLLTSTYNITYTVDSKNEIVFGTEPVDGVVIEIERIVIS